MTGLLRLPSLLRKPPEASLFRLPDAHSSVATSIIIPHYSDLLHLEQTLDALEADLQHRGDVEIIVADNNSPIDRARLEAIVGTRARLVVEERSGAGLARNAGAAVARGPVLAFIDSDCLPLPGWLAAGEAALARWDVVGGRVDTHLEHDGPATGPDLFETVFAFDNRAYVERKGFSGSGNLFCRQHVFREVGGFRAAVSEDVDWSRRARAAGYTLGYCDDAAVSHPTRSDWSALLTKWRRIQRESYALRRSEGGGALAWLARSALLPASIPIHTVRVLRSPRLPDPRLRLRAVWALARIRFWRTWDAAMVVREH